jgi:HSP20 family protein
MVRYYMTGPMPRKAMYRPVGFNGGRRIPMDIHTDEESFVITAVTPGLKAEDLKIEILGDVVTLRGEIRRDEPEQEPEYLLRELSYGAFERTLQLPEPVDAEKAEANLANGVLTVRLPRTEDARPKQIKVNAN